VTAALRSAGGLVVWTQQSFEAVPGDPRRRQRDDSPEPMMRQLRERLQPGQRSFELHPALQVAAQDLVISKQRPSAFHPYALTDLEETLSARGIETVIIMGVVTNGCCETTARDAYQLNYRVLFVTDANAAQTDEEHNASLLNLATYFADVLDASETVRLIEAGCAGAGGEAA
jgi:ureidoacrylate peracid hydrolase